ncbi:MAG: hypothetical protein ACQESK_04690 [Bacteroidota bacterium]
MSYKLIKSGLWFFGSLALLFSFGLMFSSQIRDLFSPSGVVIAAIVLCIPFFILKLLYEQKNPPSKNTKKVGWVIFGFICLYWLYELYVSFFGA